MCGYYNEIYLGNYEVRVGGSFILLTDRIYLMENIFETVCLNESSQIVFAQEYVCVVALFLGFASNC